MIWLWILGIGLLLLIIGAFSNVDFCLFAFIPIIIGFIGLVIGSLCVPYTDYTKVAENDITSIQGSINANGNFGLFFGSVNSEMYYYFYKTNDDGGNVVDKIHSSYATIYEKDIENAYIETWESIPEWDKALVSIATEKIQYKIYVPLGTIMQEYNLDTQ